MDDLKQIKNKYGENMMHLCRELFPTILESDGWIDHSICVGDSAGKIAEALNKN